jgi:hypothetical protein
VVTIQNLDVRFDVEAGDQEQLFRQLFNRVMAEWTRRQEAEQHIRQTVDRNRSLGDRAGGEEAR